MPARAHNPAISTGGFNSLYYSIYIYSNGSFAMQPAQIKPKKPS